ncbi:MAG: PKD domain-containing protein [Muribaculaceae bacterium]|nr:PKD domain-containing protein [Muribaculaceae bacterium]
MKFLRYLILFCIAVIGGTVSAQSQRELNQLMRERNEYYFTLSVHDPTEIQTINSICSVDGTDGRTVICYANQRQYDKLLQSGYQPMLMTPPSMLDKAVMWDGSNRASYAWDSYPTYDAYQSMMEGFPAQAQATGNRSCTLLDLGTLNSGRKILGVRLNNGQSDGKPKFLYSSTMHGDEVTGMMLMLRLIDEFCTSTDSRITSILENVDLFIFPLTNPDGTYYGGNSTMNSARRYNIDGVDLNRNYKDYYNGDHPDGNAWALETQWTMQLAQDYLFTISANYHGGAEVMNYPWDAVYDDHPDKAWWELISAEYVSNARTNSSSYMTDTYSSGVTNGAAWYVITGSRQDYENAYGKCREITIECSSTKKPSASTMPTYWNYNHTAMLALIEQCTKGVHGFVYDAVTNDALQGVSVTVENHDNDLSKITTYNAGDFHRPIKGGTYTFTFAKQGYYPQSVQVTVADGQRVDLEIYLEPNLNLNADFTASTTNASLGQSISFTDTSEGMVSSWSWTFEGATPSTSTEQNPTGITYNTPGDYDVTLTVTGPTGNTQTVTKENYIHVAESILMQNGSVTTCSGIFYDSGGANSNYGNSLTYTMTFYPGTEGAMVCVDFIEFNTESGYDYLYIYNGTSTSATLIGQYHGTTSPGTVMATNEAGALTFKFTSDSGVNAAGWVATVSCFQTDVPVNITVSANPSNGGTVSGGGEFVFGETCTVTATPQDGYSFVGWAENETLVSHDLEYSFTAVVDRDLVANFVEGLMIGDGGSTTDQYLPSHSYYRYTLSQQIYTAEELGSAGLITSIAFYNGGTTKTRTYDIYMVGTTKSEFTGATDWVTVTSDNLVYSGSVEMTAGDWTTLTFDTPFLYDGVSNVVLVVDDNTGSYNQGMLCSVFAAPSQALRVYSDGTNYNPFAPSSYSGTVMNVKNQLMVTKTALDGCVNTAPAGVEVSDITGRAATVSWTGFSESYNVCLGIPNIITLVDEDFSESIPTDWTNNSNYPWTIVDGHIQSGNAGVASSTSSISTTVTFLADGTIEFDAECMGEGSKGVKTIWDQCIFSIDGTAQFTNGQNVSGWKHYSFEVAEGEHTFTWSYSKDTSVDPDGDYFAVDNVLIKSSQTTWNNPISVEDDTYTFNGLTPTTDYCVRVQGVCDGVESAWSETVLFTTTEVTAITQTVTLAQGMNWWSTNLDITLAELEDAIADALGTNGTVTIKSASGGFITYTNGGWRPTSLPFDIREMLKIQVSADCAITLTGVAVDPSEYEITIHYGNNWIGCLTSESISVTEAFAGLSPEIGDVVKSKTGSATYYSTGWRGALQTLEPGQGYMYQSKATEDKTFTFPTSN